MTSTIVYLQIKNDQLEV